MNVTSQSFVTAITSISATVVGGGGGTGGVGGSGNVAGSGDVGGFAGTNGGANSSGHGGVGGNGQSGAAGGSGAPGRVKAFYLTDIGVYAAASADGAGNFPTSTPAGFKQSL